MNGNQTDMSQGTKVPLVFLVDDERMVGDLAEMILKNEGFQTRIFDNPHRTLEAFLQANPKPDLLVTDYVMGSLNGLDLITACLAAHPDLKTILISGTVEKEHIMAQRIRPDTFLAKPYRAASLVGAARDLLNLPKAQ